MSLLLSTIQEFLNEYHPGWKVASRIQGFIQIDKMPPSFSCIILNTRSMTMSWCDGNSDGRMSLIQEMAYAEHTVLHQINDIMNREAYK